jgi:hypothetical protein
MIFHTCVNKTQKEVTQMEQFRQYIKDNKLDLPAGYDDHENLIQRFLEGAQWKHKEAYDSLIVHHKFTQSFPIEI